VRRLVDSQYGDRPNSLCGNDDCGQMSAWYLFTAMGFYPVNPGEARYVLGSPALPRITLDLGHGKIFTVRAVNFSSENVYVQRLTLNGKPWRSIFLPHEAIAAGGELVFTLGPRPSKGALRAE